MMLRELNAADGARVLEPVLVGRDGVGVALEDIQGRDVLPGDVKAKKSVIFPVDAILDRGLSFPEAARARNGRVRVFLGAVVQLHQRGRPLRGLDPLGDQSLAVGRLKLSNRQVQGFLDGGVEVGFELVVLQGPRGEAYGAAGSG